MNVKERLPVLIASVMWLLSACTLETNGLSVDDGSLATVGGQPGAITNAGGSVGSIAVTTTASNNGGNAAAVNDVSDMTSAGGAAQVEIGAATSTGGMSAISGTGSSGAENGDGGRFEGTGGNASTGGNSSTGGASTNSCGGKTCAVGQFCQYPVNSGCGANHQAGSCAPKPPFCMALGAPVCGCDNKTYSNECLAWNAGVSVKSQGACVAAF
jgi:hypothetical protein